MVLPLPLPAEHDPVPVTTHVQFALGILGGRTSLNAAQSGLRILVPVLVTTIV